MWRMRKRTTKISEILVWKLILQWHRAFVCLLILDLQLLLQLLLMLSTADDFVHWATDSESQR